MFGIRQLVESIRLQTLALHRLAESNEAVIQVLAAEVANSDREPEETAGTYLDGTPVR